MVDLITFTRGRQLVYRERLRLSLCTFCFQHDVRFGSKADMCSAQADVR